MPWTEEARESSLEKRRLVGAAKRLLAQGLGTLFVEEDGSFQVTSQVGETVFQSGPDARILDRLERFERIGLGKAQPIVADNGGGWFVVTFPDGTSQKVQGKAKVEALIG